MSDLLNEFLDDRKQSNAEIKGCIEAGIAYAAFAVVSSNPHNELAIANTLRAGRKFINRKVDGNVLALAIAHCAADKFIVDTVETDISVEDAETTMKRYSISEVNTATGRKANAVTHAVSGVYALLRLQ